MIFVVFLLFGSCLTSEVVKFSTDNYPQPWYGPVPWKRVNFTTSPGFGTAVFFRQFLMAAGDCVFICEIESTNCDSLCGDVMDHPGWSKALRTFASSYVTMQSTGSPDGLVHAGIDGVIVSYEVSNPSFFQCNRTINLSDTGETFYLVSNNYPNTTLDFSRCSITFESKLNIRLALYFLANNIGTDTFTVAGIGIDGQAKNLTYSGHRITSDEPFGIYFKQKVTVDFQFFDTFSSYTRGFYILVDEYGDHPVQNNCSINTAVEEGKTISFQTANFGKKVYNSFVDCPMNFRNELDNHILLLRLQYESEKCCDTMDFTGLGEYPFDYGTFQGSQADVYYFVSNNSLSLHFKSDGVMEGPGYAGQVYNLNCLCGPSTINVSPDATYILSSPGTSGSGVTYCPSLQCSYLIQFPSDYDCLVEFPVLALRQPVQGTDVLSITNQFGVVAKQSTSVTTIPISLTMTTDQYLVQFQSSNTSSFVPSQYGKGFEMHFTLTKKSLLSKKIVFTSSYYLEDISTFKFAAGPTTTYEYSITAREGHQVFVYFFTSTGQANFVDIFDGSDATATRINNTFLNNIAGFGYRTPLVSSGRSLLIRVGANTDYLITDHDFQAMVTDEPDLPVLTMNTHLIGVTSNITKMTIIHVTDKTYNKQLYMTLRSGNNSNLKVYKGLSLDDDHIITNGSLELIPSMIFDRYLIIVPDGQANVVSQFDYLRSIAIPLTVTGNQEGTIASYDYLPWQPVTDLVQQEISVESLDSSSRSIRIDFLRSVNNGYGTITVEKHTNVLETIKFSGSDGKLSVDRCATSISIDYASKGGDDNGIYIKYRLGDLNCLSSIVRLFWVLVVVVLIVM